MPRSSSIIRITRWWAAHPATVIALFLPPLSPMATSPPPPTLATYLPTHPPPVSLTVAIAHRAAHTRAVSLIFLTFLSLPFPVSVAASIRCGVGG